MKGIKEHKESESLGDSLYRGILNNEGRARGGPIDFLDIREKRWTGRGKGSASFCQN